MGRGRRTASRSGTVSTTLRKFYYVFYVIEPVLNSVPTFRQKKLAFENLSQAAEEEEDLKICFDSYWKIRWREAVKERDAFEVEIADLA